jgi:hypothetical protein
MAKKKVTETVESAKAAEPSMDMDKYKYDEHAVRCAVEKLLEAEVIKDDPKMMKLVSAELGKKQKAIASLADLRQAKKGVQDADVEAAYGDDEEAEGEEEA